MTEQWIGLAAAVHGLRAELAEAMNQAESEQIQFELGTVCMEFAVEARQEVGGEAGVKFWVVGAATKGSSSSVSTHRLTLEMQPRYGLTNASPRIAEEG